MIRQTSAILGSSSNLNRRGTLTLELVMVLPILMILLMALVEFTLLFGAREQVVDAARAGARIASLHGVTENDVVQEVKSSLPISYGETAMIVSEMGNYSGDDVIITVAMPMNVASPNLLWPIGYNISEQQIVAQARSRKE